MQSDSGIPATACCPRHPEHVYCSLSAAESESTVKMNGCSEPPKEKDPAGGSQPRSQTPQYERKRRVASVPGIKTERLCIAAAASLVTCWPFSSTQASLVPNGGSSVLVLSACAKAVCRVYVRISLLTVVQLTPRPQTAGVCCASSIEAELADMARLAALKPFVQWANRMGVVCGSQTREGTLPANRGVSVAATPVASTAAPALASPVGPPVRGAIVPRPAAGVPPLATVSPSHVCVAEVTGATGKPPPPKPPLAWWGGGAGHGGSRDRTVVWGGNDPVGEFREPALAPHRLNSLS